MDVLILAAGRGQRLRPLTDSLPKPLIKVGQRRLIEYHLDALARVGLNKIIINISYHANLIEEYLGSGKQYGVRICFSRELDGALGTGGGILHALSLIESDHFLVINSDILTEFDFSTLNQPHAQLIHLVLAPNPKHHCEGDFSLQETGQINYPIVGKPSYTYTGIGVYHKKSFANRSAKKFSLVPLIGETISQQQVSGEIFRGAWLDVGTPQRLVQAQALYK